eukprot:2125956-Amphidinium_carterae.2
MEVYAAAGTGSAVARLSMRFNTWMTSLGSNAKEGSLSGSPLDDNADMCRCEAIVRLLPPKSCDGTAQALKWSPQ